MNYEKRRIQVNPHEEYWNWLSEDIGNIIEGRGPSRYIQSLVIDTDSEETIVEYDLGLEWLTIIRGIKKTLSEHYEGIPDEGEYYITKVSLFAEDMNSYVDILIPHTAKDTEGQILRMLTRDKELKTINEDNLSWHKARKEPVEVEATPMPAPFEVETMEGTMEGKEGDILVRGIKGELYPVDADIFYETYEVETEVFDDGR